jgi:hypothetical protein
VCVFVFLSVCSCVLPCVPVQWQSKLSVRVGVPLSALVRSNSRFQALTTLYSNCRSEHTYIHTSIALPTLSTHAHTHTRTHAHTRTHMNVNKHTQTHTHTHTSYLLGCPEADGGEGGVQLGLCAVVAEGISTQDILQLWLQVRV